MLLPLVLGITPEHDDVELPSRVDAHRVGAARVGLLGHDGLGAQRENGHDVEPTLEVGPGDANLQVEEAVWEAGGPVLLQNLSRVDFAAEQLRDAVAMNLPVREVSYPFALLDVQGPLAVYAGQAERPVRARQDDPNFLAQLLRELLLGAGPFPAGRAFQRPVPLVALLIALVDAVVREGGVRD